MHLFKNTWRLGAAAVLAVGLIAVAATSRSTPASASAPIEVATARAFGAVPCDGSPELTMATGDGVSLVNRETGAISPIVTNDPTAATAGWFNPDISQLDGVGVSRDGTHLFFTGLVAATDPDGVASNRPNIFDYDLETGRVVTFEADGGAAGAVDPTTGWFYTGAYDPADQGFTLSVYKPENVAANQDAAIAGAWLTIDVPGAFTAGGDIAFDGDGGLYLVTSGLERFVAWTLQGPMSRYEPGSRVTATQLTEVGTGGVGDINGIAFGPNNDLFTSGTEIREFGLVSPATTSTGSYQGSVPVGGTDLGSCVDPTRIRVQVDLPDGRRRPDDQFAIGVRRTVLPSTETNAATTTGSESGPQTEVDIETGTREYVGPIMPELGEAYTISVTAAAGSTADLADYTTTWECVDDNGIFDPVSGVGAQGTITTPTAVGADIVCSFTHKLNGNGTSDGNGERPSSGSASGRAALTGANPSVAGSSNPAAGTELVAGDEVEYTLTFDNTAGSMPAPVDYVDRLVGVLDDATVIVDPVLATGDGLTVSAPVDGEFTVQGMLAPGSIATATYSVQVNPDHQRGDDVLVNHLLQPGEVQNLCDDADPLCTTHPVVHPDLEVHSLSNPASGTGVVADDEIGYTLTFDNSVGTAPARIDYVDDLTDVLDDASVIGQPAVVAGEGLAVSEIADGAFTVFGTLGAGETATVTYSVAVHPASERGNEVLVNFLVRPDQIVGECIDGDSTCTIHPVPAIDLVIAISEIEDVDDSGTNTVGDIITYALAVTNTGSDELVDVELVDPMLSNVALQCPADTLAVGERMACTGPTHTITAADVAAGSVENTATVTGIDPNGTAVSDTDTVTEPATAGHPQPITGSASAMAFALIAASTLALGIALVTIARARRRPPG